MTGLDAVTVVCATFNAREAVRLTFCSLFRFHDEDIRVFVADNGSTDGAEQELARWPRVQVVTLPQRLALIRRERARQDGSVQPAPVDPAAVAEHGATLDWLVERVSTRFVVLLDSDVEFLAPGTITAMVAAADRQGLAAYGVLEPGWRGYQPRLAPHLLLLHTATVRQVGTSFQGATTFSDPGDAQRWAKRPPSFEATPAEIDEYPSIRVYATGARFFESLLARNKRFALAPEALQATFHHYGHMSWGALHDGTGGSGDTRRLVQGRRRSIGEALRAYD